MFKKKSSALPAVRAVILGLSSLVTISYSHLAAAAIDEVIVTAKTNQTLAKVLPTSHVLSRADILESNAIDLPDLLDQVSGLNTTSTGGRGSVTGVFVRGTSISQNIVLIDGVRVGSASLGQASLNSYPLDAIERIEIVKGPLSAIYGADAIGGVIQIFTRTEQDGIGSATLSVGSDGLREVGLTLGSSGERGSIILSAHAEETDGIDHTSILADGNDDLDGFDETSFSLAGKTRFGEQTSAMLSILYTDNEAEFDNTFGADSGFVTATKTLNIALSVRAQLSESLLWSTTLGTNKDDSVTEAFFSDITSNRDSVTTELEFKLNPANTLTMGVDYYQEDIETSNAFPVTDRDNKGVFGLFQSDFGKLSLVTSLRFDDNTAYGNNTNGSIAANFNFNDKLRAVLSYGTAFAAPSFNFLYFPFFGNPNLLPEKSDSLELSLLGKNANIDYRISVYQTDVENLFSFDSNTFLAANIGQAELKGLELELATRLAKWQIKASLDLLSAKDALTGVELDDRAETSFRISSNRNFRKLNLAFALRAENGRYDNGGVELASYGLFDVGGSYHFSDKFSVSAKMANVFDKDYTVNLLGFAERYNTQGRQSKLTARYKF